MQNATSLQSYPWKMLNSVCYFSSNNQRYDGISAGFIAIIILRKESRISSIFNRYIRSEIFNAYESKEILYIQFIIHSVGMGNFRFEFVIHLLLLAKHNSCDR